LGASAQEGFLPDSWRVWLEVVNLPYTLWTWRGERVGNPAARYKPVSLVKVTQRKILWAAEMPHTE